MKTIGIVCAMRSELAHILETLEDAHEQKVGLYTFYLATHGGKQVVAVLCGIGKVNAAACTQMLISVFHADCVINSGVAGALSPKLHIMDIVAAKDVMHHDLSPKFLAGDYFPGCDCFAADEELVRLVTEICREQAVPCVCGRVVSGEQFVTDSAVKAHITAQTQGDATEMEGAAVGHVCFLNQIPFAIVRCISDGADDNGAMDFDTFVVQAARRCAAITLAMIARIA